MIVAEADAHKTMCPWNDFKGCYGSRCMAWVKSGRAVERTSTTNLVETPEGTRPGDDPPPSPGDGWKREGLSRPCGYENRAKLKLPHGIEQYWIRSVPQPLGHCGRVNEGGDCYPF